MCVRRILFSVKQCVSDCFNAVFECLQKKKQPEPLRLLLLGTAGSGKTRSVQTLLQEFLRALRRANLPGRIDKKNFVKVGAPTGTAAFNLRFLNGLKNLDEDYPETAERFISPAEAGKEIGEDSPRGVGQSIRSIWDYEYLVAY